MSTSYDLASEIMGGNFLGVEEVERHFGVRYNVREMRCLADIPFTGETLIALQDTHVLVAGSEVTLNQMNERVRGSFCSAQWGWREPFADVPVGVRWHLLRKQPMPGSAGKTYRQQSGLLTSDETVSRACEMAYMAILYNVSAHHRHS